MYLLLQIQRIALQRNDDLRLQFKAEISVFNPNQLVFLDETGIVSILQCTKRSIIFLVNILFIYLYYLLKDKRIARQFGYSTRGTPPVVRDYSYSRWAPHYSVISAISSEGVLTNGILRNPEERFNTQSFIDYLEERLLPAMNPFNGENPHSVLVMGWYINYMHAYYH